MQMRMILCFLLAMFVNVGEATLEISKFFGSEMVLPHGKEVPVWGKTGPGEKVRVDFKGQKVTGTADKDGLWKVKLSSMSPDARGNELTVESGKDKKILKDVLVGEVWMASGQSNMQYTMKQFGDTKEAIAKASNPQLRVLNMTCRFYDQAKGYSQENYERILKQGIFGGQWLPVSPTTTPHFTATGYFFANALQKQLKMPVGLICNAVGGTWMESWLPVEVLDKREEYKGLKTQEWKDDPKLPAWARNRAKQEMAVLEKLGVENIKHAYAPTICYEEAVREMVDFPISGVIWYQGESNAEGDISRNVNLMKDMIEGWRANFHNENLPFVMIQLPRINSTEPLRKLWPEFREVQQEVADSMKNVSLICAYDLGGNNSNVHPPRKQELGERAAEVVFHKVYGKKGSQSPKITAVKGNKKVLMVMTDAVSLKTSDGKKPVGFEIAGENTEYLPAVAKIQGNKILLVNPDIANPVDVRYSWAVYSEPNVVNEAGLPLFPYRSSKVVKEPAAERLGKFPKNRKVKIACIGDSITAGAGIKEAQNHYPEVLGVMLGDKFEVKNFGNSGKTAGDYPSQQHAKKWYAANTEFQDAIEYQADVYICNLGINDTGNWWDPAVFEEGYAYIIKSMKGNRNPAFVAWTKLAPDFRGQVGKKAYPGNVFEPEYKFPKSDNKSSINRPVAEGIISRLAKTHKAYPLDAYTPLAKSPDSYTGDGLHPNEKGAIKIAEFTYKWLASHYKLPAKP